MHIGLDYDDTITLDPELWDRVIALFIDAGHQVTIVTIRSDRHGADDIKNYADAHGIPAVFTFGCQKDTFTAALGITIDIWIDDTPLLIPDCKEMPGLVLGNTGQSSALSIMSRQLRPISVAITTITGAPFL